MEYTREEILEKAKERGYSVVMHSGDKSWYSLVHSYKRMNLQVYPKTNEFELVFIKGILKLTTGNCGSFMTDSHFKRIEKEMSKAVFDLL